MLHKPPCRQIEKQARTFVAYPAPGTAKTGKAEMSRAGQIHGTSADVSALHAHGETFSL